MHQPSARGSYLETEVLSAPPQKLHLMLIEGAIRFAERGRRHWAAAQWEEADEVFLRAEAIVTELLAAIHREANEVLARKLASIYLFVFRTLLEASLKRSETHLDDALRVLREEQETWRTVCERIAADPAEAAASAEAFRALSRPQPAAEVVARAEALSPQAFPVEGAPSPAEAPGGFSLDA